MRIEDVPQDSASLYGGEKKLLYAVDAQGRYAGVPSAGWQVETYATGEAVAQFDALRADALARLGDGAASPLEVHMYARRMDIDTLAAAAGIWRWRVRRHFQQRIFARLPPKLLRRYASALDISVEALCAPPAGN